MGLFTRKRGPGLSGQSRQYVDELTEKAQQLYDNQRFASAFETFAEAVDKLHTMEVVAQPESRIRRHSTADQTILDGVVSSLGASLASGQAPADYLKTVGRTCAYLEEIVNEADRGQGPSHPYRDAVARVNRYVRDFG